MSQSPLRSPRSQATVRAADLKRLANGWLLDCEYRHLSQATLDARRGTVEKFLWWLEREGHEVCGSIEIRGFMAYLRSAHEHPEGRFGNPHLKKPLSARSLKDWHVNLSTRKKVRRAVN